MKTVLLIDDDSVVRKLLRQSLERSHWHVWEASDGEEGIAMFRKHQPSAVVTDLLMPNVNGFEVISTIRGESSSRHCRIVALSSKSFSSDKERALQIGADVFVGKPVVPSELESLLEELTGSREIEPDEKEGDGATPAPLQVRFWGVRGSVPSPGPATVYYGGNTSCIEVRAGNEIIILDSGTGIRELGRSLVAEFKEKPLKVTILITHTHWDHIQGFPFFMPAYNPKNQIRVFGYEGARAGLAGILSHQMESPYFPVELKKLPGHITITELKKMELAVGEVRVKAAFVNHPGICVGYRLEFGGGSLAYLPDNEPFQRRNQSQTEADGKRKSKGGATEFSMAEDKKILDFIRGVDLLILDAQYDAEEYLKHAGWGHGCVEDAVHMAGRAGVKHLHLFHHDPTHDDETITRMLGQARKFAQQGGTGLKVDAAREGAICKWPLDGA